MNYVENITIPKTQTFVLFYYSNVIYDRIAGYYAR
jgi:hypothetical protein